MKSVRCMFGWHDHVWKITITEPRLNWQECKRCGHVDSEWEEHYEAWQEVQE